MSPADHRQVVAERVCIRVEECLVFRATTKVEAARDGHQHVVFEIAVRPDANVVDAEEVRVRPMDGAPVEGKPEVVHHVVAQHFRVADCDRLREVVAPAESRRQHIS